MDNMSGTSGVVERSPQRMRTSDHMAIVSVDDSKRIYFTLTMHGKEHAIELREYVRKTDDSWMATDRGFHVPAVKFGKVGGATSKTERALTRFGLVDGDDSHGLRKKTYRRG
jgi:hypothetical protein